MWIVSATLLPVAIAGSLAYGLYASLVIATAIASALGTEALITTLRKRFSVTDGSAFLTGLLIGLAMPPRVGLLLPMLASAFAIAFIKQSFGGLGCNWMNPALGGTAFAYLGWPELMNNWIIPRQVSGVEGVSGATPFMLISDAVARSAVAGSPYTTIRQSGVAISDGGWVTDWINYILAPLNIDIPKNYLDFLFGDSAGAIASPGTAFVFLGSIILIALGILNWKIILATFGSFVALTFTFGGLPFGTGLFTGDALFGIVAGSFPLIGLYMATDPVTSPDTSRGRLAYGISIGVLAFVFRTFGAVGDGITYAVLVMNCFAPWIDKKMARLFPKKGIAQ
jgi:electron transport complex protein RnfD